MQKRAMHSTAGVQKNAVDSTEFWDFRPEQHVMTIDGFPGVVTAVYDGPFPGTEEYAVTLDNGLGGGAYTASQLQPSNQTTASGHTASEGYPELADVLRDRPDPGQIHTVARGNSEPNYGDPWAWAGSQEEFFEHPWDLASNLPGYAKDEEALEDKSKNPGDGQ